MLTFNLIVIADSFNIDDFSKCKAPSNIKADSIGLDFAKIVWKKNNSVLKWKIKWREKGKKYSQGGTSPFLIDNEFKIENLKSSTKYYYRLKTFCDDNSESDWSFENSFITHFDTPSNCNLDFELKDAFERMENNKLVLVPGKSIFITENVEYPNGKLGVNVFLKNVKVIIKHSWMSDLEIKLYSPSPSGKSIVLTSSHGNIGYGDPFQSNCVGSIDFSDEACSPIEDNNTDYFVGNFKPDDPIYFLYDSLSPLGEWKLEILDKKLSNSGTLEYFELEFEEIICPIPVIKSIVPQNGNSFLIKWDALPNVDSIYINIEENGNNTLLYADNLGYYLLENLNLGLDYSISFQSKCFNGISSFSCSDSISLLCGIPSLREGFDNYEICESSCEDCLQSDLWFNNSTSKNWLINSGETSTKNTGPNSDVYGNGKYIYFESSESDCEYDSIAILESECILVEPAVDGCSFEFHYHMYGIDIGSLSFEVSIDNGRNWKKLFFAEGINSNRWIKQEIDLIEYENKLCNFRFIAKSNNHGSYGDIAIDDIIFYNSTIPDIGANLFYPDRDNDGYGKDTIGVFFCNLTDTTFVYNNLDCDDNNQLINPDAEEILCNFIDENCNGMDDDSQLDNSLSISIDTIKNESCNGSKDGQIVLSISNGIPPYSFKWSNMSVDSVLTNVGSGKYWCEIKDQTGCGILTDTFFIDHENPIQFNILEMDLPSCNGIMNGSISIDYNGGVEPFKYLWNTSDTSKNINNISAGIYKITITDSLGCIIVSPDIQLKATTSFDIQLLSKVEPSCFNSENGSILLNVEGGKEPYSFEWNNGETTKDITKLGAGEFYCTITDSELCFQEYGPINLLSPDSIDIAISTIDHVTCIGENNGFIELVTKGGNSPYTFEWYFQNSLMSRNDDIYKLVAGDYSVQVTDVNGCKKSLENIKIKTIDSIKINLDSIQDVSCSGTNDGLIKVSIDNNYGDNYYYWNTGKLDTNIITGIKSGLYSITVVDDLGCKQVLNNIEIKNLNLPLDVNVFIQDSIKCFNDNTGSIITEVISDNTPFDYNWSAGKKIIKAEKIDTLINLPIGEYNVTVTDNKGCVGKSILIKLSQPDKLVLKNIESKNILCFGDNSGQISLELEGGIIPYNVFWNDSTSGLNINRLDTGEYKAVILDDNDCKIESEVIVISQPEELTATIESNPSHKNEADGSARILPKGGVSPYYYIWDENANSQTENEVFNLKSGWYTVTLTDNNECSKELKVFINESTSLDDNILSQIVDLYPNPVDNNIYIHLKNNISTISSISLFDLAGIKQDVRFYLSNDGLIQTDLSILSNGTYILKLNMVGGRQYYSRIVVIHK